MMNTDKTAVNLLQACVKLGITRRTLNKWMKRLNIHSHRHIYDLRLLMVYTKDLERIAAAREEMARAAAGEEVE